jgi:hypothetical protein
MYIHLWTRCVIEKFFPRRSLFGTLPSAPSGKRSPVGGSLWGKQFIRLVLHRHNLGEAIGLPPHHDKQVQALCLQQQVNSVVCDVSSAIIGSISAGIPRDTSEICVWERWCPVVLVLANCAHGSMHLPARLCKRADERASKVITHDIREHTYKIAKTRK